MSPWLVAGCNSDEDMEAVKGPTILKLSEREAILEGVKWVDEVAYDAPYTSDSSDLDLAHINCQFWVHGDDPCYTP